MGLEEYLSGGDVCVVEWADRAAEIFPQESNWIALEYGTRETDRLISIDAKADDDRRLLCPLSRALENPEKGWSRV